MEDYLTEIDNMKINFIEERKKVVEYIHASKIISPDRIGQLLE